MTRWPFPETVKNSAASGGCTHAPSRTGRSNSRALSAVPRGTLRHTSRSRSRPFRTLRPCTLAEPRAGGVPETWRPRVNPVSLATIWRSRRVASSATSGSLAMSHSR